MTKKKETKAKKGQIKSSEYILLDRSGSMGGDRWVEALGSINSYVQNLINNKENSEITVVAFDSDAEMRFEVLRDEVSVKDWKDLSNADATPRGGTPLLDALAKMIDKAEARDNEKTVLIVMTDGGENSSREYKRDTITARLDAFKKKGWQVVFLGADFNAFGEAAGLGVGMGQTLNMSGGNFGNAMKSLYATRSAYVDNEAACMSFSDADRAVAVGQTPTDTKGSA